MLHPSLAWVRTNNINLSVLHKDDSFLPAASKSAPSVEVGFPATLSMSKKAARTHLAPLPSPLVSPVPLDSAKSQGALQTKGTHNRLFQSRLPPEQAHQELIKIPETEGD